MDVAIRLSCILAMLFCLAGTGNAEDIDQDRLRLQQIQSLSEQSTDPITHIQITNEIVEIYKRYRGQEGSDAAKETELNAKVENFKNVLNFMSSTKLLFIKGQPKQGVFSYDSIQDRMKQDATYALINSAKALVDDVAKYLLHTLWHSLGVGK